MTPRSRLSAITPCLNQVGYLEDCLANIRRQPEVLEHIVIDGASSDGTVALLEQARAIDPRLRFRSRDDSGMYEAVNDGLAMARGELLCYLNCDDLFLPWTGALVELAFSEHPDVDIVYGDAIEFDPVTARCALAVQPPVVLLKSWLESGGHLAQPAVFFHRRLLRELGGFDESLQLLADHDFWLRALRGGRRWHKIWEYLAVQRCSEHQLMRRHRLRADDERQRVMLAHTGRMPGPSRRRAQALSYAALHRIGLLGVLAVKGLSRLPGLQNLAPPWGRSVAAGFFSVQDWSVLLRALASPSRDLCYFRAGDAVATQFCIYE